MRDERHQGREHAPGKHDACNPFPRPELLEKEGLVYVTIQNGQTVDFEGVVLTGY